MSSTATRRRAVWSLAWPNSSGWSPRSSSSGTQANEVATRLLTEPGTELLVEEHAPLIDYELAGLAAISGIQVRPACVWSSLDPGGSGWCFVSMSRVTTSSVRLPLSPTRCSEGYTIAYCP